MKKVYYEDLENYEQVMSFEIGDDLDEDGYFINVETYKWWQDLANSLDFIEENVERSFEGSDEVIIADDEKWYVSELQDYINIAAEIKEKKTNTKNMNINMDVIKDLLLDETVSIYSIAKDIGVSRSTLNLYRTGQSKLENMSIKLAKKLQQYINDKTV